MRFFTSNVARLATALVMLVAMAPTAAADPRPAAAQVGAAAPGNPAVSGFVTRSGQELMLNGAPYRFTGLNIYNANSVNNYWYTMGVGPALDDALTAMGPGKNVFRAWFGQWLANPTGKGLDYSVFDHTLAVARAHGYRVIVTFADQDGTWDDGISKTLDSGWYQQGYRTTVSTVASSWGARNGLTYRDFVRSVVERYRDDPTVLMWQLINEAEAKRSDGSCSSATDDAAAAAIRGFADDMSRMIKSVDGNHLVSLGTIGTGQCGTSGPRYQNVHSPAGIDLLEMHDYVAGQSLIGDQWNGMKLRLDQARALNKPIFVGELGVDPKEVGGLDARARVVGTKLRDQFDAGVVGVVAWEWRNAGRSGGDRFVVGPGDPVLDSLDLSRYFGVPTPGSGRWTTAGSARIDGEQIRLTTADQTNAAGAAFYPVPLKSDSIQVAFDLEIGGGGGADGLTLAMIDPAGATGRPLVGAPGGGLGWSGLGGYAVAFDTFRNGGDPGSSFVGLANGRRPDQPDQLVWAAHSGPMPSLRAGTHRVQIRVTKGKLTVDFDGQQALASSVTLPPTVLIGFTAATGGLTDRHTVSGVSVAARPAG